jgi:zinc protease
MKKYLLLSLFVFTQANAATSFLDSVKRLKWGDLEVVWVEDEKFPRFTASVYFEDGALKDKVPGTTQTTFEQLSAGTSKETQRQIAEFFDFYGANLKNSVTHEYSVSSVQALTRDIEPVMGKFCELWKDAQYPEGELRSYISRSKSQLKNLVTSHQNLADRVFRKLSLAGTPYETPVEGTLAGYDKLNAGLLKTRLAELRNARKVLYLAGPKEVLSMEKTLSNCGWTSGRKLPELDLKKPGSQSAIYLIPVPGANQAQIRIGRYVTKREVEGKYDQFQFLASFLGGSFTSKLVQELRVKRGLTYSAGAYVAIQRDYGRAGITTFSKSETAAEAIGIVRDVFAEISQGGVTPEEFKHQQGHMIGGYAFGFEETSAFIGQLMLYDHQRRPLIELQEFPEKIAKLRPSDLAHANLEVFPWEKLTIVVVGDKSLEKTLSKIRPVRVLDYNDFL